ncbi:MAG: hypothetical protein A2848_02390 [Candidatus Magasanikbacteria bacterium RIFCSPHIGHO2_01_FULL_50_8]|uniref:Uncharacterized protein n=2 Tax=Candidatus Magasanikiibacteriota TaxID=1752731 RepID=A0A1F6LM96_9BACT|nr:MAG: hypothetical protein A2848_02390 [Candidatus Magasanikbacteria bacterium RIFCSPHIGHO2_01_FULL_50_8]OGH68063.1 MAG: hypothetical protein A3C15_01905 [Candidatus Magasanikbacteria bacterium RIFCSPHIGHO2_02_FULL_50_9b]
MATHELLSPENAARDFRLWRLNHRPTATIAELFAETQIPTKDLRMILSTKAGAGRFTGHISAFLEAFKSNDLVSLQELRVGQSPTLPPPHSAANYSAEQLGAIKTRQSRMVRSLGRPYCQITRQEISPRQCLITQTPRDCYGCGAPTRFCTECQFDIVAFPGAELCAFCLTKRLAEDETDKLRHVWTISVECKLSGNRQISTATCGRLQGDACSGCNAVTRICVICKSRRVRYVDFGMCLKCHTMALGFGWHPLPIDEMTAKRIERDTFFSSIAIVVQLPAPQKQTESVSASVVLTKALSHLWCAIRKHHIDVPDAMILPGTKRHAPGALPGKFTGLLWQPSASTTGKRVHEVIVIAEYLNRTAEEILGTLLHEATHAMNFKRGVRDCTRSHYHNRRFKDAAEEIGLSVAQVVHYGFAITSVLPETTKRYATEIAELATVLMCRRIETTVETPTPDDGNVTPASAATPTASPERGGRYKKASCKCPHNIRISRATLAATTIVCKKCGAPFKIAT